MTDTEKISPSPSPSKSFVLPSMAFLDFHQALDQMMLGKKVTKTDWDNPEFYGVINEGHIRLHKPDGKLYDWILTEDDIIGEDFITI